MTQDEIIEMAQQAHFNSKTWIDIYNEGITTGDVRGYLQAFANLVAAKATEEANARANASWELMCKKMVAFEREACAKLCDELPAPNVYSDSDKGMWDITSLACGDAIRARGEQA